MGDGRRWFLARGGGGSGGLGGGVGIVAEDGSVVVEGDEGVVVGLLVRWGGRRWGASRVEGAVRGFPLSFLLSSVGESFDGSFVTVLDGKLHALLDVSIDEAGALEKGRGGEKLVSVASSGSSNLDASLSCRTFATVDRTASVDLLQRRRESKYQRPGNWKSTKKGDGEREEQTRSQLTSQLSSSPWSYRSPPPVPPTGPFSPRTSPKPWSSL